MLFSRLALPMDFSAISQEIKHLLDGAWIDHVNNRAYSGKWDVLPLRSLQQYQHSHPILQAFSIQVGELWKDLDILQTCPVLQNWLSSFLCPLKSVRLMRLASGSHIKPHCDNGLDWTSGEARLHVPIITSDQVSFLVKGQPVPMKEGELWYINAGELHEVKNDSCHDRIHLVIDCEVNDWLSEHFSDDSTLLSAR